MVGGRGKGGSRTRRQVGHGKRAGVIEIGQGKAGLQSKCMRGPVVRVVSGGIPSQRLEGSGAGGRSGSKIGRSVRVKVSPPMSAHGPSSRSVCDG